MIDENTADLLRSDVEEYKTIVKQQKSKPDLLAGARVESSIRVTVLNGQRFEVPITVESTVKDVKMHIGTRIDRDPKTIRLIFNGTELKVSAMNCT